MPFYLSSNTLYFFLSLSLSLAAWLSFPLCLFLCLSIIFSFFFLVFLFLTPCRVTSEARPAPRVSRGVGVSEKRSNPEKPEKHHLHAKTRVSEVTEWVPNIAGLIFSVQIRREKCSPISCHLSCNQNRTSPWCLWFPFVVQLSFIFQTNDCNQTAAQTF